jgi:hypothetical protein
MQKAADVKHFYFGRAVPFGITVYVFGDKDHVALAHAKALVQVYIRSVSF